MPLTSRFSVCAPSPRRVNWVGLGGEAQAGRNSEGKPDDERPITELAKQGPELLKRVEAAKKIYAELRSIAEREAALRK